MEVMPSIVMDKAIAQEEGYICIEDIVQGYYEHACALRAGDSVEEYVEYVVNKIEELDYYRRDMILPDTDNLLREAHHIYDAETIQSIDNLHIHCYNNAATMYTMAMTGYMQLCGQDPAEADITDAAMKSQPDHMPQLAELAELEAQVAGLAGSHGPAIHDEIDINRRLVEKCEEIYGICRDTLTGCVIARRPVSFSPIHPADAIRALNRIRDAIHHIHRNCLPKRTEFMIATHPILAPSATTAATAAQPEGAATAAE
jgi:hypothetical protein